MNPKKMVWQVGSAAFHASRNVVLKRTPALGHALLRLGNIGGRGSGLEGARAADYFASVVDDYEQIARFTGVTREGEGLFKGRSVLELGLGNTRSVALLARVRGAEHYEGSDAFDVLSRDRAYLASIYEPLLAREKAEGGMTRAEELLREVPVHHELAALTQAGARFDLVISRAVLEHVADLEGLFAAVRKVSTDDAVMIHKVDLRCHGNKWDHELDFLTFPEHVYQAMASHTGMPNRARVSEYLALGARHGFSLVWAGATHRIAESEVERVRDELAERFRVMSASTLAVLGVWLVMVGPSHPLAQNAGTREAISVDEIPIAPAELLSRY